MIWFILSLPLAIGIGSVFMGWSGMKLLPPEILTTIGGIIIFITLWVGYRQYLSGLVGDTKKGEIEKGIIKETSGKLLSLYNDVGIFLQYYDSMSNEKRREKSEIIDNRVSDITDFFNEAMFSLGQEVAKTINKMIDSIYSYKKRIQETNEYDNQYKIYTEFIKDSKINKDHIENYFRELISQTEQANNPPTDPI